VTDSDFFAGETIDNLPAGLIRVLNLKGNHYEGQYEYSGNINGFGRFYFYGIYYTGWWKNNVAHGNGRLVDSFGIVW